jgi:hypothetical protein
MSPNSFKELDRINIENRKTNGDNIKSNLNSNIKLFSFVSDILEIYLPKVGEVFTSMVIDSSKSNTKKP